MKITDKGFKELLDLQLITAEKDDKWSPTSKLKEIASNWLIPLPAVFHEAVTIKADGSKESVSNIALRGSGPLCQIEWENNTNHKQEVSMHFVKKDDYWLHLMGIMTPPRAEEISTTVTEFEKPEAEQKAKSSEESSVELIYKCPSCGAIINKGQKFCTSCGFKLPENLEPVAEESPEIKICPKCGAELKPGTKFCTECGAKV